MKVLQTTKFSIRNERGSTMVYALLLGAVVIGLSKFGWDSLTNLKDNEKKSNQSTEVQRDFENIKRYLSLRRICDYHVKEFVNENPKAETEKAFAKLVTLNSLGLTGRTITQLSYDSSNKLVTKRYQARVLDIVFKRPAINPKALGNGLFKAYIFPTKTSIALEVKYGQCIKQGCELNELKKQVLKFDIPVIVRTTINGTKIQSISCDVPISDVQKEALAKACSGVGGRIGDIDQICKFPLYDPCKLLREGPSPDIEKFKTCMLQYTNKEISPTDYVPFQDSICRLDMITAENSAKAFGYTPAILGKNPETGQTEIKEGSNTGNTWRVTTKYCSKLKAWQK